MLQCLWAPLVFETLQKTVVALIIIFFFKATCIYSYTLNHSYNLRSDYQLMPATRQGDVYLTHSFTAQVTKVYQQI